MDELQRKVRELRMKMGWVQEDLARKIGVSLSTVQRWERKETRPNRIARRVLESLFQEANLKE